MISVTSLTGQNDDIMAGKCFLHHWPTAAFPIQRDSNADVWWFLCCWPWQAVEQTHPVANELRCIVCCHCNVRPRKIRGSCPLITAVVSRSWNICSSQIFLAPSVHTSYHIHHLEIPKNTGLPRVNGANKQGVDVHSHRQNNHSAKTA